MKIESIKFKRTNAHAEETGILINEAAGPIIDLNGEVVTEIWDYRRDGRYAITVEN